MTDTLELIRNLVAAYGPPGQENAVRDEMAGRIRALGYSPEVDPKGNLLVTLPGTCPDAKPPILITAHLDEIALMIVKIEDDGRIRVAAYGGAHPWKWGEGPMDILAPGGNVPCVLSFGSIHTESPTSVAVQARTNPLKWESAYLFTGLSKERLAEAGVRPGLRVVKAESRRVVTTFGEYVASYFLDDRADLAVMLLALEQIREQSLTFGSTLVFAATVSEEVGGDGAQYLLRTRPADICVALEIGPKTPESDFPIDSQPTLWVRDGYAAMESVDGELLTECCAELGQKPHWQYMSRGGSDASCAASSGLTARPVTLGLPVENSHGYEIMHRDAPFELTRLLLAYLRKASGEGT